MDKDFKFELNDSVSLKYSDETGVVIGRSQYTDSANQYYVIYKAGDGRQITSWWDESHIGMKATYSLSNYCGCKAMVNGPGKSGNLTANKGDSSNGKS